MNDYDDEVRAHPDSVSREPRALALLRFVLRLVVLLFPFLGNPDPAPDEIVAEAVIGPEESPEFVPVVPELDDEYEDPPPLRRVSKTLGISAEHLGSVSKTTTVPAEHLGSVSSAA